MTEIFPTRPAVTVATLVERQGRYLIVEEWAEGRRVLNQPAGHLEPGEDPLDAAVRETLEETGWRVQPEFLVGVYLWEHPSRAHSYLRLAFGARALGHDPDRPLDEGIIQPLWLTPEEIAARRADWRSPLLLRCVEDAARGQRYPLDLLTVLLASSTT